MLKTLFISDHYNNPIMEYTIIMLVIIDIYSNTYFTIPVLYMYSCTYYNIIKVHVQDLSPYFGIGMMRCYFHYNGMDAEVIESVKKYVNVEVAAYDLNIHSRMLLGFLDFLGARLERMWNISLTLIEAELGSKVRVSNRGVTNKLFVNVVLKKVLKRSHFR